MVQAQDTGASAVSWQPIETAPKDQEIDLWVIPSGGSRSFRAPDCAWRLVGGKEQWVSRGDSGWEPLSPLGTITHWLPIPTGPVPAGNAPQVSALTPPDDQEGEGE